MTETEGFVSEAIAVEIDVSVEEVTVEIASGDGFFLVCAGIECASRDVADNVADCL